MFTAGIDEAGRGPLAGPVVAAAVIIPEDTDIPAMLTDSKMLTAAQRENLFGFITENYYYGIGLVSEKEIDKINILQATFKAMAQALGKLKKEPGLCLIDGSLTNPLIKLPQQAIVKGDQKIKAISAASIIAKVTRDRIMDKYDLEYPEYQFGKNKGYGTREHLEAILKHGRCPIHRESFSVCLQDKLF